MGEGTIRIFILHGITFAWAFFALSDRGVKTAVNLLAIAGVSVLGQFFLYWCWLPALRAKSRALAAYRRERERHRRGLWRRERVRAHAERGRGRGRRFPLAREEPGEEEPERR